MVIINELWDQSATKIEEIVSSLKQNQLELEPEDYATRLQKILETFHLMCESLQPVLHLFKGVDLESLSSQELLQCLLRKSQDSVNKGELVEAVSLNNGSQHKYRGILVPSQVKHMDTVWEWLNSDRVGTICMEGKVGMSKTWMARQLKDRAIAANLFDVVIWIDSNQTCLVEAQEHIVDRLGLSIRRKPNEKRYYKKDLMREVALSLGKKRYLLIINDFRYDDAVVEDFGFSDPWQQNNSSKVLISGPKENIDRIEKEKICQVEPLDIDEALLLFLGVHGLDINSPHIFEIAEPFVASFKGVPSKIISCGGDAAELITKVCDLLNSGKMEVIEGIRFCNYFSEADTRIQWQDFVPWWIAKISLDDDCVGFEEASAKAYNLSQMFFDSPFLKLNETRVWDIINENLKSIQWGPAGCLPRAEVDFLLMHGKQGCLPRTIPDLFFKEMQKLSTLAIVNAGIVSLPESLSNLRKLETLIIRGCTSLTNLHPIRGLRNLQFLRLSVACSLNKIPDDIFQNMDQLVELDLSNNQLKQLPMSFSKLGNIRTLILQRCSQLESIPSMEAFDKLILLDLSGATALTSIPDTVYSVTTLDLSGTLIKSLPSPSNLTNLEKLFLRGCTEITTMPHPDGYDALDVLDLSGATSFREFQGQALIFDSFILSKLDLSETLIVQLPLVRSFKITKILLRNCVHLETMPALDFDLEVLDLSGSIAFKNFQDGPLPDQLSNLDLSKTHICKIPMLSTHCVLVRLILRECGLLEELPHLELQRLQVLDLSGSTKFKTFKDDTFKKLQKLMTLDLSETQVANIPTLLQCRELRQLMLRKCLKLEELPHIITLEKLELLDLSGAISFKRFQDLSLGKKDKLHELNLSETQVVRIPSLSRCYNLGKLILDRCSKLEILPDLEDIWGLELLNLSKAISLIEFHFKFSYSSLKVIDISGTQISDLSFIARCINLWELSLKDCPNILTLPPLDELIRLEKLDLSRTAITELLFLSRCRSLRQLLLNDCSNIQELTSLKKHTRLEVLDLSGTKIDDLSVLTGLKKLSQLSLAGCPNLKTLSFQGMQNLQKLNLSHNPIKLLPSSFSGIKNLQTLLLTDCSSLETLPHMEFLSKLEVLDLSCTNVRKFPNDISALAHLRFLKLQEENRIWKFHDGKSFEKFHICLFAPREKLGENDIYLQGQQYSFRDVYYQTSHIPSITEEPDKFFKICGFQIFPAGIKEILLHVELLYLKKNNFLTRLSDLGAEYVREMRECWIENCDSMETVFYGEEVDENAALGRCLQNLWVSKLHELKSLFRGVVQPGSFTVLKHLYIECCPSLITVFSSHLELKNLEVLKIKFCDKIEGIYGETVLGENTLPSLKTLILLKLPELQSICGGVLRSIRSLRVIGCKKLKKLPFNENWTAPLVKVKGEVVWWNDLEWEDNDTKSQLQFSPI